MVQLLLDNKILFVCFLVLIILLLRNPFSPDSIISNFEPLPDAIHYVNPALSFLQGKGLKITREGRSIITNVSPLYSISLIPFYLINRDPRMFYFANVLFALISTYLFYLILKGITKNNFILRLTLLMYVTNFVVYWYPNFAMSENLLFPILLGSILVLIQQVNKKTLIIAGLIPTILFATKYSAFPFCIVFVLLYLIKLKLSRSNLDYYIFFGIFIVVTFLIFVAFEYVTKGINILEWISTLVLFIPQRLNSAHAIPSYISYNNFHDNFYQYLGGLMGGPLIMTKMEIQIIPVLLGMMSLISIFLNIGFKKNRFISFSLLANFIALIFLISNFYAEDGRYIFPLIPVMLISFAIFLTNLEEALKKLQKLMYFRLTLFLIVCYYLLAVFSPVKKELINNFIGSKTITAYNVVTTYNKFFASVNTKIKPVLITILSPFIVDFYSNNSYHVLPLTKYVAFASSEELREIVWGKDDYRDLISLYNNYLVQGYPVYVSNYLIDKNLSCYINKCFQALTNTFILTEVLKGCDGQCNIYKISLRKSELGY